ncbi:unspecified product [Leishmania tarentolae]|uniref:Unspecified product n=1 Tax=Leishmania tarentolae TaxID=5689 RepID=A0A640KJM5_LEITA|nr:unspecified product [Leishmania tarentolae]
MPCLLRRQCTMHTHTHTQRRACWRAVPDTLSDSPCPTPTHKRTDGHALALAFLPFPCLRCARGTRPRCVCVRVGAAD